MKKKNSFLLHLKILYDLKPHTSFVKGCHSFPLMRYVELKIEKLKKTWAERWAHVFFKFWIFKFMFLTNEKNWYFSWKIYMVSKCEESEYEIKMRTILWLPRGPAHALLDHTAYRPWWSKWLCTPKFWILKFALLTNEKKWKLVTKDLYRYEM